MMAPPRLYCIRARHAPVAVVFRRGPSDWYHVLRWDLTSLKIEPGAWVKAKMFPTRCDLSDDGKLLLYFLSGKFNGNVGIFVGVSHVPGLHPLHQWEEANTYCRGWHFVEAASSHGIGDVMDISVGDSQVRVQENEPVTFLNELRRGWAYTPDCPPRAPDDRWDELRDVVIERSVGDLRLRLARHRGGSCVEIGEGRSYTLVSPSGEQPLEEASWADLDDQGRLLIATRTGHLRIEDVRDGHRHTIETHDLCGMTPKPTEPSDRAAS